MTRDQFLKYINHECSLEEKREMELFLESKEGQAALEKFLDEQWKENENLHDIDDDRQKRILQKIHVKIKSKEKPLKSNFWKSTFKSAAVLILAIISSYFLFSQIKSIKQEKTLQTSVETIQRTTNTGEKLTIKLPDETEVILNSNSKIIFEMPFGKEIRKVDVEGEAFFEVKKDLEKPFIVQSGNIKTQALGTSFNVRLINQQVEIQLAEGKVKVWNSSKEVSDEVLLEPGQQASLEFFNDAETIKVSSFDLRKALAWKENKLIFQSTPFSQVLMNLESWYGVEFILLDGFNDQRKITGEFRNENLKAILSGLAYTLNFEFEINKKQVKIMPMRE